MGLFSFFHKNKNQDKQTSTFDGGEFYARAGDTSNLGKERGKSNKAHMSDDPVLPEKKRARRRLVGAVALALAAIIGLPMILDSEPKPLENDILIQIPSKDKSSFLSASQQSSTSSLASASASVAVEASPAESQMATSDTLDSKEEVVTPPSPPSLAPALRAPVNNLAAVAPSHSPAKNVTKHAVQAPTANATNKKSSEALSEAARANAILEGKINGKSNDTTEEHAPHKTARFVVQVAALADQEKITALKAKLKSAGIVSHTQKVATQTGERTRIRVGPYSNKEDAEKVRTKLEKLGLSGSVLPL